MMSQVPFTEDGCGVVALLEKFGDSHFIFVDAEFGSVIQSPMDADAIGIAAGEQSRPGGGTDSLGDIKIGEPDTLGCHLIQMGRLEAPGTVTPHVGIALIVR